MRRCLALILFLMVFLPFFSEAQTLTNRDRRHINTKVLNLLEEYERTAVVYDEEAEYVFRDLFENGQIPIVCDILGFADYMGKVTVDGYINALKTDAVTVTMEVKDVEKGEMTVSGSDCVIPLKFRKSISYVDRNGYFFSTDQYYKTDLFMDMTVRYNLDTDRCTIISLDGTVESERKFPEGRFFIINKSQLEDVSDKNRRYLEELKIDNTSISYNEFDQAILPAGVPSVRDIDVQVFSDTLMKGPNYDVMKFDFKARKTRLKIHYGIAPFGAYEIVTPNMIASSSDAMEAGLDIGFTWRAGKTGKMGFFFGAGASMSNIALSLGSPLNYSYTTASFDPSTSLFVNRTVTYDINTASEALSFLDIYVPVYFEIEHKVGKRLLISWNLGAKGYYNMQTKWTPYTVSGRSTMQDSVNGSSQASDFTLTGGPFISPSSYQRTPFDISLIANLGFDVNLAKNKVYLSVKAGYEYGLFNSYSNDKNTYFKTEKNNNIYPVVYNTVSGSHVAVHSMITDLNYRRKGIWLQAGLKFKM